MAKGDKLGDKQELFCKEYLVDLNATQAAIRAGYSEKTAQEIGSENLSKPIIQKRISELKAARSKKLNITQERVLLELAKIGFANIADFLSAGNKIKNISELKKNKAAAIASIEINEFEGGTSTKFKLHDKLSALEKIAKHIGFFKEDNEQSAGMNFTLTNDEIDSVKKKFDKEI